MHPIDAQDLARVYGGYNLDQTLEAGNNTAEKIGVAGGVLGAAYGGITGTRAHMRGAKSFVGIKKLPAYASGPAAYGIGAAATLAGVGWIYSAGRDVICQTTGKFCVAPSASADPP